MCVSCESDVKQCGWQARIELYVLAPLGESDSSVRFIEDWVLAFDQPPHTYLCF